MLEALEMVTGALSLVRSVEVLSSLSVTDMMVVFLLSKPLFVIVAMGALYKGYVDGSTHYLSAEKAMQ